MTPQRGTSALGTTATTTPRKLSVQHGIVVISLVTTSTQGPTTIAVTGVCVVGFTDRAAPSKTVTTVTSCFIAFEASSTVDRTAQLTRPWPPWAQEVTITYIGAATVTLTGTSQSGTSLTHGASATIDIT